MTGPKKGNITALGLYGVIIVIGTYYSVFIVPFYCLYFSPLPIIPPYIIVLIAVFFVLRCQFMDPGIILSKSLHVLIERTPFLSKLPDPNIEEPSAILRIYTYRWCNTCYIWRPPKASHCSSCDNCVEEFDQ